MIRLNLRASVISTEIEITETLFYQYQYQTSKPWLFESSVGSQIENNLIIF